MTTLVLRSNPGRGAPNVLVADRGFEVPVDHTTPGTTDVETFTKRRAVISVADSDDLRTWATDEFYGAGSSTIIINDGTNDIPQEDVIPFLDNLAAGGDGTTEGGARNTAETQVLPGRIPFTGSFSAWNNTGQIKKGDIFFGRMWLVPGTYIGIEYMPAETKAGDFECGVYADDGATPPRPTGARLAFADEPIPGLPATIHRVEFAANLVVTEGAYFWFGLKTRANDLNVSTTSHEYDEGWGDVLYAFQTGVGDIEIPATLGGAPTFDANANTALPFFAVVQEGA